MTTAATAAARPRPPDPRDKRVRSFVTPEGVDLRLRLADAGERGGAFLLDMTIMVVTLVAITFAAIAAATATGFQNFNVAAIIWLLAFFVLRNFYFTFFELGPRAATPGKRVVGLRVAARDGGRLTAQAVIARNAMRELEVFLPISFLFAGGEDIDAVIVLAGVVWSAIFVFLPAFNRDKLRAGDLIAGTWVIRNPKRTLDADLAAPDHHPTGDFAFTEEHLDAYGVHELQVLEDVLRRDDAETILAVAERIRGKIGWTKSATEGDRAFLAAYYPALRKRLEAKLLMGVRRRDKHDKR